MNWSTLFPEIKRSLARVATGLSALTLAASVVLLPACQQGGNASNNAASASGGDSNLAIGLTDAKGDFISYSVDVKSLTLTKANGAVVETVPEKTTVDFAQYTDLTEFFTAATVPNGAYTSAKMTLDYSAANIQVEDADGNAVKVGNILDADGNAITTLEVNVKLEGKRKLVIAPGIPASLTLDFDLKASNTVSDDLSSVVVEPYLLAEVESHKPKLHRMRGGLKSVDVANSSFELALRPFAHGLKDADRHERFGAMNVITNDATVFEIDGVTYDGSTGLKTLNTMAAFTAVVAIGDLKFNPRRFEAREVYAGSSVPGGTLDVVTGDVIKRVGTTLTVKGATLVRKGGGMIFNDEVTVTVATTTKVHRQLSRELFGIGDISVGQRVTVHGELAENAGSLNMNAANGSVRMLLTTLRGAVVSTDSVNHRLVLNLQTIDGRQVKIFDFSGTGTDGAHDADPANYEVETGSLDLSRLTVGGPLALRGFVAPFGFAPKDFVAHTLVDVADVSTTMFVKWAPASDTAFSAVSAMGLTLNLAGSSRHEVRRAGVKTDLTGKTPVIQPAGDDDGLYFVKQAEVTQMYTTFADFAKGIQTRLDANAKVDGLVASGTYVDSSTILTSRFVAVSMK